MCPHTRVPSWARRHGCEELLSKKDNENLASIPYQPQRPDKCQEKAIWSLSTQVVDVALRGQSSYWTILVGISSSFNHRCLQRCVGTQARLGYAAFDAQLRKRILSLHCTLYICLCVPKHAYAIWLVATCLRIQSLWYEYTWFEITRAMPGPAGAYGFNNR